MRLALEKHVLVGAPATQRLKTVAPMTPLDRRVVALVTGLAVAAGASLIAAGHGLIATVADQPVVLEQDQTK